MNTTKHADNQRMLTIKQLYNYFDSASNTQTPLSMHVL